MAIARKLCKGQPDGKRCRRWKNLTNEGYCEVCNNTSNSDNDGDSDEPCGMCPLNAQNDVAVASNDTNSNPDTQIQCDGCEDWFHASCAGSKDFIDYIGHDPPDGVDHSNGGLAIHLWLCSICVAKKATILTEVQSFLKKSVSALTAGTVASRPPTEDERT